MFRFEKLDVWHKAIAFADLVYSVSRQFPDDERFGLTSQMRRASVSISSNIAEGSGRTSDKDFARFLEIAYSSVLETLSQAHIAQRQAFLKEADFRQLYVKSEELTRMLSGLKGKLGG